MRFGFDLDEVVCDLTTSLLDLMYDSYGVNHTIEVFNGYDFYANDYCGHDETNKNIADMLVRAVRDLGVLSNCKPDERFARLVSMLYAYGYEIHFITARQPEAEDITIDWLDRHKIPYTSLTIIGYGNNKGPKIKALGLDYFVDDFIVNIEAAINYDEKLKGKTFMVDKPWNRDYINNNVIRVHNEFGIINHVMEEKNVEGNR